MFSQILVQLPAKSPISGSICASPMRIGILPNAGQDLEPARADSESKDKLA
jgi:hypothetical protein